MIQRNELIPHNNTAKILDTLTQEPNKGTYRYNAHQVFATTLAALTVFLAFIHGSHASKAKGDVCTFNLLANGTNYLVVMNLLICDRNITQVYQNVTENHCNAVLLMNNTVKVLYELINQTSNFFLYRDLTKLPQHEIEECLMKLFMNIVDQILPTKFDAGTAGTTLGITAMFLLLLVYPAVWLVREKLKTQPVAPAVAPAVELAPIPQQPVNPEPHNVEEGSEGMLRIPSNRPN